MQLLGIYETDPPGPQRIINGPPRTSTNHKRTPKLQQIINGPSELQTIINGPPELQLIITDPRINKHFETNTSGYRCAEKDHSRTL